LEDKIYTVAFTGHRNINREDILLLPSLLEKTILTLAHRGAVVFRAGGAIGFDMLAALKVLDMKERLPQLELELILPCKNQTERWDAASVRTYNYILKNSTRHRFLYDSYVDGCMLARDRQLIEGADVCVAYCTRSQGGAAYTCAYALKNGLELINLYDTLHP
jgi:uncharacterized phage-like protein YoqJ